MKTSCISHPAGDFFVRMSAWQIAASDGNHCAAALLSMFEYWHNNRLEAAEQSAKVNDIKERFGDKRDQSESLMQYHNAEQLKASLLGLFAEDTIRDAIRLLSSKGFVKVCKNPNPRYAFDRTLHFLFEPDAVNEWLQSYEPGSYITPKTKKKAHAGKIGDASPKNPAPSPEKLDSLTKATLEATVRPCAEAQPFEGVSVTSPAATGELPFSEGETPATVHPFPPPRPAGASEASNAAPTPTKAQKPATAKPKGDVSDHRRVSDAFCAAYLRRVGTPYIFQDAKDGAIVKKILKAIPVERALEMLARMESAPDGWAHKACKAGLTELGAWLYRLNAIQSELNAPAPKPWQKAGPIAPVGQFTETKAHDPVEFFKP